MGFSPEWSPRVARPRLPSARSVCSLVYRGPRLPAPSSGRDYAGQSLSSCRVRRSSGCSGGGGWGKDRARARVRGTSPPTPSESLRDGGAEGRRWAPGPICPSRFLARVFRRVRPSRGRLRLGRSRSRGAVVPRVMRAVCSRAVRLSPRPPFLGSVPTAGGIAEVPLPPRGPGGPVSRVMGLALGGGPFWGNDGWSRPARRRTSGPAAARGSSAVGTGVVVGLSRVGVLLGLPWGRWVSGRLGTAGVAGLLRECAV